MIAFATTLLSATGVLGLLTKIPFLGGMLRFFTTDIGRIVGVILLAIGIYYYGFFKGKGEGYEQAIAAIAAKDEAAIGRAVKARDAVDACEQSGGVWDSTRGKCNGR